MDRKKEDNITNNIIDILFDDDFYQIYFAVKFFEDITRSVNIQKRGENGVELVRVVFSLNPKIMYLTEGTKENFFLNVNRETHYTKILSMMEYSVYFYEEIKFNYDKSKNNLVLQFLNKIHFIYFDYSVFFIALVTNLLMIPNYEIVDDKTFINIESKRMIYITVVFSIVWNFIILSIWTYFKYPLYRIVETQKYKEKLRLTRKEQNFTYIDLIRIIIINSIFAKSEMIFYLFNILINLIGLKLELHWAYSFQLLGMIFLHETLKDIVRAITFRSKMLGQVFIFLVITLFSFGFVFFLFKNDSLSYNINNSTENMCESLIYCFLTMVNLGLRNEGGIGKSVSMTSFNKDQSSYITDFSFSLGFFILVNIVIVSMLLGIIFDTFGEFREKAQEKEDDILNVCFICGKRREKLEKEGVNFTKHLKDDHNADYYFEYLIGLMFLDSKNTNSINSHVITMMEKRQISWVPSTLDDQDDLEFQRN